MSNHVRLPAERVEQLRQIAEAKGKSVAEVIGDFVRSEIEAGTIPNHVPGVTVEKAGLTLVIRSKDFEANFSIGEGANLADILKSSRVSDAERKKRWVECAAALSGIRVKRAGNGLKIISPVTGNELPLSLDVAADVGDQIERATK